MSSPAPAQARGVTVRGYWLPFVPTPARRAEIYAACEAEARRRAELIGAAAWFDTDPGKVLTPEEYAALRAAWTDSRNPGTVTMAGLFIAFVNPI